MSDDARHSRVAVIVLGHRHQDVLGNLKRHVAASSLVSLPALIVVVISCWSALTGPGERRVVNVFAGVPALGFVTKWDRACGAEDSAARVRARLAEDAEVLGALGHQPAYLPFVDRQLGARWPGLDEIDAAVAEAVPAASVAYAPAALGFSHSDHLPVREYARALARRAMPVVLYADLPYAARSGDWPAWVHRGGDRTGSDHAFWRPALRALPEIAEVKAVALTPAAADAKLAAMRAYRTQFAGLDHVGRLSGPRTYSREVYWTLTSSRARVRPRAPT